MEAVSILSGVKGQRCHRSLFVQNNETVSRVGLAYLEAEWENGVKRRGGGLTMAACVQFSSICSRGCSGTASSTKSRPLIRFFPNVGEVFSGHGVSGFSLSGESPPFPFSRRRKNNSFQLRAKKTSTQTKSILFSCRCDLIRLTFSPPTSLASFLFTC